MIFCALNNLLIDIDRLSVIWKGEMELFDQEQGEDAPFTLISLQNGSVHINYDLPSI